MRTHNRTILLLAGLCAVGGLILVWAYETRSDSPSTTAGEVAGASPAPSVEAGARVSKDGGATHGANKTPPILPSERPRVVIQRGPRRPNETASEYARRKTFVTRFDDFVAASGISEAKQQALLLALYDYQEAYNAAIRDALSTPLEREPDTGVVDDGFGHRLRDTSRALGDAILGILGLEQHGTWLAHCTGCHFYLIADTEDASRILRLAEE